MKYSVILTVGPYCIGPAGGRLEYWFVKNNEVTIGET
jgi:hypothetical protein